MVKQPVITILGTGYVGLTTAVLFAEGGYKVHAVEINPERLESIRNGKSFFYEEGIDSLIEHSLKTKNLIPTDSYEQSVPNSQFVFSCVGTPDNPDGSSNLSYVFSAAEEAAELMKDGTIFIQKSTVPVGTGQQIEHLFQRSAKALPYVSNPEFLREGTAIADSLWPDRIVTGSNDKAAAENVIKLYKKIEAHRNTIAKRAGLRPPANSKSENFVTNRNSAELIKVTANAFLALKISFANSIAKLADQASADVNEVMDAVGADKRIGRAFLNAGRGYGGGCFPKDVSGLISSANEYGVDLEIMIAASKLNESMPGYIANKAQDQLGSLQGKKLAVLGLAFKSGTSDARRSPGVKLANILAKAGAKVTAYDPKANHEAAADLRKGIVIEDSIAQAVKDADAVFIATDWPELINLNLSKLKSNMRGKLVIDCMNALNADNVQRAGLQYIGIGRF